MPVPCCGMTGCRASHVIELEQAVLDSSVYFDFLSGAPLENPRSHRILQDGRIHLTYTDKTYDVITSEPSNPWIAGVSNLFTVDFYERVRKRLSRDGVFGQWIQLYEMSEPTLQVMLASLHAVFPHVVIFLSPPLDMMVIASAEPITIPWSELENRFSIPAVSDDFRRVGILTPGQLMFYFLASEDAVTNYVAVRKLSTRTTMFGSSTACHSNSFAIIRRSIRSCSEGLAARDGVTEAHNPRYTSHIGDPRHGGIQLQSRFQSLRG